MLGIERDGDDEHIPTETIAEQSLNLMQVAHHLIAYLLIALRVKKIDEDRFSFDVLLVKIDPRAFGHRRIGALQGVLQPDIPKPGLASVGPEHLGMAPLKNTGNQQHRGERDEEPPRGGSSGILHGILKVCWRCATSGWTSGAPQ